MTTKKKVLSWKVSSRAGEIGTWIRWRREAVAAKVVEVDADVVCLQDVGDTTYIIRRKLVPCDYDVVCHGEVMIAWKRASFNLVRSEVFFFEGALLVHLKPSLVVGCFQKEIGREVFVFNADFQAPTVVAGTNVRRVVQAPKPPAPSPPVCVPINSRSSVLVKWTRPPAVVPPVENYWIQRRYGGRVWSEPVAVRELDCTRFRTEEYVARGKVRKRTVADPDYHFVSAGLASGVCYEFRVAAENRLGRGPWSEPSQPFATAFYYKAPLARRLVEDETAEDERQARLFPPTNKTTAAPRLLLTKDEVRRQQQQQRCSGIPPTTTTTNKSPPPFVREEERSLLHPYASETGLTPRQGTSPFLDYGRYRLAALHLPEEEGDCILYSKGALSVASRASFPEEEQQHHAKEHPSDHRAHVVVFNFEEEEEL